MDFGIDMGLAHAPGDELRDLGAEIEDEDFLVLHGGKNRLSLRSQKPEHHCWVRAWLLWAV
jgi:hypothetical protein